MTIGRWIVLGSLLLALGFGCGTAPKSFQGLHSPSGIVRARAMSLGGGLAPDVVIPALIERLDDPDPVVRLAANEELKKKSQRDFGFVPWADAKERQPALASWRSWWNAQQAALANSRTKH